MGEQSVHSDIVAHEAHLFDTRDLALRSARRDAGVKVPQRALGGDIDCIPAASTMIATQVSAKLTPNATSLHLYDAQRRTYVTAFRIKSTALADC